MNENVEILPAMKSASRTIGNCYRSHVHAEMLDDAAKQFADMLGDIRQALAALGQNKTYPADVVLARAALNRALARAGVA